MRKVSLQMLTPDMILGKPVCKGTTILINSGSKDLTKYISRLEQLGIYHLYIEDAASEGIEIDDLITDRTRLTCKKTLEKSFRNLKSNSTVDIRQITSITQNLLDEILSNPSTLVSVNDIAGIGDNTLDHSINTTIYAICLANQLGYKKTQMKHLANGTLLHDIGKTVLDSNILFKSETLNSEEMEHIRLHPVLGYDLLKHNDKLSEASKIVALTHHERMDGSGYPFGMNGSDLSELSRIAAIVDVYEALTVDRCYHKAIPPYRAIEILTAEAGSKLDLRLTSIFMQNIAVYPNGSTVLLSTGQTAVVKAQNSALPLRPVVRVISIKDGKWVPGEEIDLVTTLNITISEPERMLSQTLSPK